MKSKTQSDLLYHAQYTFSQYANKNITSEFDLSQAEDILPGWLHVNNGNTIELNHVGKKGLRLLEKSNEEIQREGLSYLNTVIDDYSKVVIALTLPPFFQARDRHDAISFFQRIRYSPMHDFELYYTTSKILDDDNLVSLTIPVNSFEKLDKSINELVTERSCVIRNFQLYKTLTIREKEIFKLLAIGKNYMQIGDLLHISPETVKKHKQKIYFKLDIHKISALVRIAINLGVCEW